MGPREKQIPNLGSPHVPPTGSAPLRMTSPSDAHSVTTVFTEHHVLERARDLHQNVSKPRPTSSDSNNVTAFPSKSDGMPQFLQKRSESALSGTASSGGAIASQMHGNTTKMFHEPAIARLYHQKFINNNIHGNGNGIGHGVQSARQVPPGHLHTGGTVRNSEHLCTSQHDHGDPTTMTPQDLSAPAAAPTRHHPAPGLPSQYAASHPPSDQPSGTMHAPHPMEEHHRLRADRATNHNVPFSALTVAQKYGLVMGDVQSPFASFLREAFGITRFSNGHPTFMAGHFQPGTPMRLLGILAYGRETSTNVWQNGLERRWRIVTEPSRDPMQDPTIRTVIMNANHLHQQICVALLNTADVLDEEKSREVSRILNIAKGTSQHDSLEDIDATARQILVALLHRCVVGSPNFRNRDDPTQEDVGMNCWERCCAVINVLRHTKTVCRDVLEEDGRIYILVHQPFKIWKTKITQKKTNITKKETSQRTKPGAEKFKMRFPEEDIEDAASLSHPAQPAEQVGESLASQVAPTQAIQVLAPQAVPAEGLPSGLPSQAAPVQGIQLPHSRARPGKAAKLPHSQAASEPAIQLQESNTMPAKASQQRQTRKIMPINHETDRGSQIGHNPIASTPPPSKARALETTIWKRKAVEQKSSPSASKRQKRENLAPHVNQEEGLRKAKQAIGPLVDLCPNVVRHRDTTLEDDNQESQSKTSMHEDLGMGSHLRPTNMLNRSHETHDACSGRP